MIDRRASILQSTREAHAILGRWGLGALAAILLAAVVSFQPVIDFARAVLTPAPPASASASDLEPRVKAFLASLDRDADAIRGRSMFFIPPPPPPPAPPPPPPDQEPPPPPPPSKYGGPAIIAMIRGDVWFDDGKRLRAGDPAQGGIRVISENTPWGATIEWDGREWQVPLFTRTTSNFLERPSTPTQPTEDTAQDEPPSADPSVETPAP